MTTYTDLYLRANLSDVGGIPGQGAMCTSPDIIPWGTEPVPDPTNHFADFSKDQSQALLWGNTNYIYTRATNLAVGDEAGELHLYWSRASLINYPFLWSDQSISCVSGSSLNYSAQNTNQEIVGAQPFVWTPQVVVSANDHICLISQMVTPKNPNPIPLASNISDFAAFIQSNRGFAWKNINIQNLPAVPAGSVPDWSTKVNYDQGEMAANIFVVLVLNNVPIGSKVNFTCGGPGPDPMLHMEKTEVIQANQVSGVTSKIPANFSAPITYNLWLSGNKPPIPNMPTSITLEAHYIPGEREAKQLRAMPIHQGRLANFHIDSNIKPLVGVPVGSFTTTTVA